MTRSFVIAVVLAAAGAFAQGGEAAPAAAAPSPLPEGVTPAPPVNTAPAAAAPAPEAAPAAAAPAEAPAAAPANEGVPAAVEQHPANEERTPEGEHAGAEGEEHAQGDATCVEHHAKDVPGYIIHHVSDDCAVTLEAPGPLYTGENPRLDLYKTFSFLLIETKPGACQATATPQYLDTAFAAGKWKRMGEGCIDLRPTKSVFMMWVAALLLMLALFLGTNRKKSQLVPKGASQNLLELLVLFVRDEMAVKNIGKEEGPRYTPYLLTIFFFILFCNLLGLIPEASTATGNLGITAGLAICTFLVTQLAAIRAAGLGGYLKHLTGGVHWALWPIMVPVEILGLFTKPFALTVRLFANMLAGHIVLFFLLALIFLLHAAMAAVSVPMAAGIYFLEIFVAFVQAYIFCMLSSLFIGMGVAMGHHAEHDSHDHGDHHVEGSHSHDHGKAHMVG